MVAKHQKHRNKKRTRKKKKNYPVSAACSEKNDLLSYLADRPVSEKIRPGPNWFTKLFTPEFDELQVGLIGYSAALMLLFDKAFRAFILGSTIKEHIHYGVYSFIALMVVILVPIYHVFSHDGKSENDKRILVCTAVFAYGLSGFFIGGKLCSMYIWALPLGLFLVCRAMMLVFLYARNYVDESSLADTDTPFWGAIANFFAVTTIYFIMKFWFGLAWPECFSLSVLFIMVFSLPIRDLIYR